MKTLIACAVLLLSACGGGGEPDVSCTTSQGFTSSTTDCTFKNPAAQQAQSSAQATTVDTADLARQALDQAARNQRTAESICGAGAANLNCRRSFGGTL